MAGGDDGKVVKVETRKRGKRGILHLTRLYTNRYTCIFAAALTGALFIMTLSYILLIEVCFSLSAVQSCLVIGRRGCPLSCCSWEALVDHRPDQAAIVPFFLSCSPRCTLGDTLHGHFLCRARAPGGRRAGGPFLASEIGLEFSFSFLARSHRIRLDLIGQPHSIFGSPSIDRSAAAAS